MDGHSDIASSGNGALHLLVTQTAGKPAPSDVMAAGAQAAAVRGAYGLSARTIFHEPWWLDIATGGNWKLASVRDKQGQVVAEMPYSVTRNGIWEISKMPPLTRTLGPVIADSEEGACSDWRHRYGIMKGLIAQLPECAYFHQRFDPRISDVLAVSLHGFEVSVSFTLTIEPGKLESDVWAGLRQNTRNLIRRASEQLVVRQVLDADVFGDFYDANLDRRNRGNMYGSSVMRQLVRACIVRNSGMVLGAFGPNDDLCAGIVLIWDASAMYYLLSSRTNEAHGGAISLLLWAAICDARERNLTFDFDGISNAGIFQFLSGFGGTLATRLEVTRVKTDYAAVRSMLRLAKDASQAVVQRLKR
jgi:hypothetical protein